MWNRECEYERYCVCECECDVYVDVRAGDPSGDNLRGRAVRRLQRHKQDGAHALPRHPTQDHHWYLFYSSTLLLLYCSSLFVLCAL